MEGDAPSRRSCQAGHLPGLRGRQVGRSKALARRVHDLYFNPRVEDFAPRSIWSLSNAFTSVFKELSHSAGNGQTENIS